jgi:hypothetical protein
MVRGWRTSAVPGMILCFELDFGVKSGVIRRDKYMI